MLLEKKYLTFSCLEWLFLPADNLINFENILDPDQTWQIVRSDLDPNCLMLWCCYWKNFLNRLILEKEIHRWQNSMQNYLAWKEYSISYKLACAYRSESLIEIHAPGGILSFFFFIHRLEITPKTSPVFVVTPKKYPLNLYNPQKIFIFLNPPPPPPKKNIFFYWNSRFWHDTPPPPPPTPPKWSESTFFWKYQITPPPSLGHMPICTFCWTPA